MRTNTRDLGLNHGPGKGDADRTDRKKFIKGLEKVKGLGAIKPDADPSFKRTGLGKWQKSYK